LENQINLSNEIHFVVDYRSCPSGIGSIFLDDVGGHKQILITDADCGPKDMEAARETFNPDAMPDFVDHIPLGNQFWDVVNQALGAILVSTHVKYVVDTELAYEYPELTDPDGGENKTIFTIQNWLKARDIQGIL
jgi:hypothetical protein